MIKHDVDLRGIQPEIVLARVIVGEIFTRFNSSAIITSGLDGDPSRREQSKHPNGYALDFRIRHLDKRLWPIVAEEINKALGPQYDVVLEARKLHIHVEFDPKE